MYVSYGCLAIEFVLDWSSFFGDVAVLLRFGTCDASSCFALSIDGSAAVLSQWFPLTHGFSPICLVIPKNK